MAKQSQSREERIKANALKALEEMGTPPDMEATEIADGVVLDSAEYEEYIEKLKIENVELVEKYTAAQTSLTALSESVATLTQQLADKDAEIAQIKAEISNDVE
jgi:phage shock protein A